MRADYFRTLYDYNYATHRRIWDCIMHLSDEQFVQDVNYSIGSIRNHYVHLIGADDRWLSRLQGVALPAAVGNEDFTAREATRRRWEQVAEAMQTYLNTLNEAQLDEIVHYDMPHRGGMKHDPRWQVLLHVANHGTDHRAQILRVLHDLGAPTFEQDLMIYLWEH